MSERPWIYAVKISWPEIACLLLAFLLSDWLWWENLMIAGACGLLVWSLYRLAAGAPE